MTRSSPWVAECPAGQVSYVVRYNLLQLRQVWRSAMAHVMKIKQGAVAPLVAHYERTPELERGFARGNIDPSTGW